MSCQVEVVSRPVNDPRLPDRLAPAALLLRRAEADGLLAACENAFVMGRRNGHTGAGISVFLLVYLLVNPRVGLRPFAEGARQGLKRLARLVGLHRMPSAGAVSRALGRLDSEQAATFTDGVLTAIPGLNDALSAPGVQHQDDQGHRWHVLDVDPTVKAFRQRQLESDESRPAGVRLSPGCPGYTGQKRGELRIRSVPVAHAGLGCWLAYRMWEDNPHISVALMEVITAAVGAMTAAEVPSHQVIIRLDGEFGNAGCMGRMADFGVQFITRLSRYALLRRPDVSSALMSASWHAVGDGEGGKEAADLGLFALHPSSKSADAGRPPVDVRVVVCRRKSRGKPSHGVEIEGYVYELFATSLAPAHWSCASIAELYQGRASMENLLAQEDRELGLDRTFSYSPAGQALAVSLGLMLWNYLTVRGLQAEGSQVSPAPTPPAPEPWMDEVPQQVAAPPIPTQQGGPSAAERSGHELPQQGSPETGPALPEAPAPPTASVPHTFRSAPEEERQKLSAILAHSFGDILVGDWKLNAEDATATCPNDKRLFPFSVATTGRGRPRPQLLIRTDFSACNGCPFRDGCLTSSRPNALKQIARAVTPAEASWIQGFLKRHPPRRKPRRPSQRPKRVSKHQPVPAESPTDAGKPFFRPLPQQSPNSRRPTKPSTCPSAHRNRARNILASVKGVEIRLVPCRDRQSGAARRNRRHGRMTWSDRRDLWRAPRPASVVFEVPGNIANTKNCPIRSFQCAE